MSKIIFFEYIHHFGGAQISSIDVITNLVKIGNQVIVIDAVGEIKKFKDLVEQSGAVYISFGRNYNFKLKFTLAGILSFCFACVQYSHDILMLLFNTFRLKPDIVFTNSLKGLIPIVCGRIFSKYKIFFYLRGITSEPLSPFSKNILICMTDKIFVQANQIKLYLINNGIRRNKISVIPNALTNLFLETEFIADVGISKLNVKKIGIVSSVIPTKGYNELICACGKLKNVNANFVLYIVGGFLDQGYEHYIKSKIRELELDEHVKFLGHRDDVGNILKAIDIFVLPSYAEGTPRSVLEAMALGKAVIVSNVGGIPDFIDDGKTGLIIQSKNTEQLFKSLDLLINNTKFATEIGDNARKFVRTNFTMEMQKRLLSKEFI